MLVPPVLPPWLHASRIVAMAEGVRVVVLSAASLLQAGHQSSWADSSGCLWRFPKSWGTPIAGCCVSWKIWSSNDLHTNLVQRYVLCDFTCFFLLGESSYRCHTWGNSCGWTATFPTGDEFQLPSGAFGMGKGVKKNTPNSKNVIGKQW